MKIGRFRFDSSKSLLIECDDTCHSLLNLPHTDNLRHLSTMLIQARVKNSPYHNLAQLHDAIEMALRLGEAYVELVTNAKCYLTNLNSTTGENIVEGKITQCDLYESDDKSHSLFDKEFLYRILFEQASVGVVVRGVGKEEIYQINDQYLSLLGRTKRDMGSFTFREVTHSGDQEVHDRLEQRMIKNELREYSVHKRYMRPDGTWIWALVTCRALWVPGQKPNAIIAIAQDVTEHKTTQLVQSFIAAKSSYADDHTFLQALCDFMVDEVLLGATIHITENTNSRNKKVQSILASSGPRAFSPSTTLEFPAYVVTQERNSAFRVRSKLKLEEDKSFSLSAKSVLSWMMDGQKRLGLIIIEPASDSQALICEVIISTITPTVRADFIEKRNRVQIWNQANYDSLTEIPNRRYIYSIVETEINRIQRAGGMAALFLLDLDNFKEVNDTAGHIIGDKLLQLVANRLSHLIRESDYLARLGGDEFVILFTNVDQTSHLTKMVEKIQDQLNTEFIIDTHSYFIGSSIGIAMIPDDGAEVDRVFVCADQAMYRAKELGKNQHSFFSKELNEQLQRRTQISRALRTAIEQDQLSLVFQPIFDLKALRFTKAEALLRWQHPDMGIISPDEFIPIAETTGLIHSIGDWVFSQAIEKLSLLHESYDRDFQICINKSPVQFQAYDKNYDYSKWLEILKIHGISPRAVIIEITENVFIDKTPDVASTIQKMRNEGFQFALDDFGSGYSSLGYLRTLGVDYLKIDQQFIRTMSEGSEDVSLCRAIIAMAHELGISVVAEGVETSLQYELLRELDAEYLQGYFLSKPVPFEALMQCLTNGDASTSG